MAHGYSDLANGYGWQSGVHRAPVGYQHPWLVVTQEGTFGTWSREKARACWRDYKTTGNFELVLDTAELP